MDRFHTMIILVDAGILCTKTTIMPIKKRIAAVESSVEKSPNESTRHRAYSLCEICWFTYLQDIFY